MGFKITAIICGSEFSAETETTAGAYERIRSILNNCGECEFNELSKYMMILVDMYRGEVDPRHYDNHLIIEKV